MFPPQRTPRQRIIDLITGTRLSSYQLAQMLGIPERQVEEHLTHVVKTIARDKTRRFILEPVRHCLRDEAKEVPTDARPQAWKNRRRIRWNTLRIFSGRERRRWSQIVRRSRKVNVGQAPHPGTLSGL